MHIINIFSAIAIFIISTHTIYNLVIIEEKYSTEYIFFVLTNIGLWFITTMFYMLTFYWNETQDKKTLNEYKIDPELYPFYDILIPCYKEDEKIIQKTINSCINLDYPKNKLRIHLLDDSNRKELNTMINNFVLNNMEKNQGLIITYNTREDNAYNKAGNLNTFLRNQKNPAPLLTVFDCDMIPKKKFAQRIIPYICNFEENQISINRDIGIVQSPQDFYNYEPINFYNFFYQIDRLDVKNSIYYKLMQPSMNTLDCASYVGTNAIINREALERCNYFYQGHATEDTITSLVMNYTLTVTSDTQTYKNHYIYPSNDIESSLAYGFAPETLAESFDQRLRWVKGSIQLIMNNNPLLCGKKLNILQRISYFQSNFYWVFGIIFFLQIISHIILLSRYINNPQNFTDSLTDLFTYLFSYSSHFILFLLFPKVSIGSKIGAMIMFVTYTPVYIYAFLSYLIPSIFKISRSANKSIQNNWHFLFSFHFIILILIWTLVSIGLSYNQLNNLQISNILVMAIFYTIGFFPVLFGLLRSVFGYTHHVKNPRCDIELNDIGYS
ncbi:MAG: hypothetical protein CMF62_03965 [Magnetococcales bacterium]|nr:hypothetical protein [Magnetococcales bacterium]